MPNENIEKKSNLDFKDTFEKFVEPEEPELSQEDAIINFQENTKKKKNNDDESSETEEEKEHLKRVKQELLESLKRVEKLEQEMYGKKAQEQLKKEIDNTEKEQNKNITKENIATKEEIKIEEPVNSKENVRARGGIEREREQ